MSRAPELIREYWDWHAQADPAPIGMHGWIQWKGTDVCMDIRCDCGELHHVDADFAYNLVLPCGRVVMVSQHVRLVEVPEGLKATVAAGDGICVRAAE